MSDLQQAIDNVGNWRDALIRPEDLDVVVAAARKVVGFDLDRAERMKCFYCGGDGERIGSPAEVLKGPSTCGFCNGTGRVLVAPGRKGTE